MYIIKVMNINSYNINKLYIMKRINNKSVKKNNKFE